MTAEQTARREIDRLLAAARWIIQDVAQADIGVGRGVAIREFPLATPSPAVMPSPSQGEGQGGGSASKPEKRPSPGRPLSADYLLYVDGKAAGVIEAKKKGATLRGVEVQSAKHAEGLPASLPAWRRPLPFLYDSTGVETHFTNTLDPEPRARNVFAFHTPETLAAWLGTTAAVAPSSSQAASPSPF